MIPFIFAIFVLPMYNNPKPWIFRQMKTPPNIKNRNSRIFIAEIRNAIENIVIRLLIYACSVQSNDVALCVWGDYQTYPWLFQWMFQKLYHLGSEYSNAYAEKGVLLGVTLLYL